MTDDKLEQIIEKVADRTKVSPDDIKGRDGSNAIRFARMVYGWLAYRTRAGSLQEISGHIGRTHTAAIYWRDTIEEKRGLNRTIRTLTDELRQEFSQ